MFQTRFNEDPKDPNEKLVRRMTRLEFLLHFCCSYSCHISLLASLFFSIIIMSSSMDPKLFKTLVSCTCLVGVKMLITNFYAAIPTGMLNVLVVCLVRPNTENVQVFGALHVSNPGRTFCSITQPTDLLSSLPRALLPNYYFAAQSGFAPPEDSYLWKPLIGVEQKFGVGEDDKDKELSKSRAMVRAQRVVGNDLENIPIGLAILWTAGFAAPDSAGTVATLAQVFCAARVGHSIVYLAGIPYLRSFVFMAGYVATMGAAVVGLKGVGSL